MQNGESDILREAIERNAAAVVSLPSAGMMRHCRSRFLGEQENGFWAESSPAERSLIDQLAAAGQPVGVSFKSGITKVVFLTTILRRDPEYRINAEMTVEALLLRLPEDIKAIQRRNNYRVRVSPEGDLKVRIWRIGDKADLKEPPLAAQQIPTIIHDISAGGLGVHFHAKEGQLPRLTSDDRLRVELQFRDVQLLLEGSMVHPARLPECSTAAAGIQFRALQEDLEGRQTSAKLTRIMGELQREEARRSCLGVGKTA